ncbi:hypothetical protein P7K49_003387, partial [Saguinus oedipus]
MGTEQLPPASRAPLTMACREGTIHLKPACIQDPADCLQRRDCPSETSLQPLTMAYRR